GVRVTRGLGDPGCAALEPEHGGGRGHPGCLRPDRGGWSTAASGCPRRRRIEPTVRPPIIGWRRADLRQQRYPGGAAVAARTRSASAGFGGLLQLDDRRPPPSE